MVQLFLPPLYSYSQTSYVSMHKLINTFLQLLYQPVVFLNKPDPKILYDLTYMQNQNEKRRGRKTGRKKGAKENFGDA